MTDQSTIGPDHIRRAAFVYIRQSSLAQVENNTDHSTEAPWEAGMLPAANLPTTLLRQSNVASVSRARVSRCIRPAAAAVLAIFVAPRPPRRPHSVCRRRPSLHNASLSTPVPVTSAPRKWVALARSTAPRCMCPRDWATIACSRPRRHPPASMRTAAFAKSRHAISMASVSTPRTDRKARPRIRIATSGPQWSAVSQGTMRPKPRGGKLAARTSRRASLPCR